MEEIVTDGRTGLHFAPGNSEDLAAKVKWAWIHPHEMEEMGRAARAEYKAMYTAERNYEMLMEIYTKAIAARGQGLISETRDGIRVQLQVESAKSMGARRSLVRE
jgi:hypothetical protein